jgi:hypothetical protein
LVKPTLTIRGRYMSCLNGIKSKNPTMTIKGFIVHCVSKVNEMEQKFDWENALIDAAITSAVTFFSALGGGAVAGLESLSVAEAATIAALTQFFVFLALKRGIVPPKET